MGNQIDYDNMDYKELRERVRAMAPKDMFIRNIILTKISKLSTKQLVEISLSSEFRRIYKSCAAYTV